MRLEGMIFRVQAEIDGTKYEPGPIKASEAEKLNGWTGYTLREWEAKLVNGDPLAARGMLGLFRFRAGENVPFKSLEVNDCDSIDAAYVNEQGQVLDFKQDSDGDLVKVNGKPVMLLDGEEVQPGPLAKKARRGAAASPTD